MRNLTAFTSLSFPYVLTLRGGIVFDDLPLLQMVNLSMLRLVLDTRLKDLPQLRTFSVDPTWFGSAGFTEVKNIGISSLDQLFRIGFFNDDISIEGIPNVKSLAYTLFEAQSVSIRGDGDLALSFDCTACTSALNPLRQEKASSIEISGANSVVRNRTADDSEVPVATADGEVAELIVGTFAAERNTFASLPLDFTNLSSLYILDNANLTTLWFNANFSHYAWKDIVIRGNPKLRMNSTAVIPYTLRSPSLNTTWVWPSVDVGSMTFEGPFDNDFLSVSSKPCFLGVSNANR